MTLFSPIFRGLAALPSAERLLPSPRRTAWKRHRTHSLPAYCFSAGLSNGAMVELDMTENGLRAGLLKEPFKAVNGYVELDDTKYGLGIELDESVIEKYRVEL